MTIIVHVAHAQHPRPASGGRPPVLVPAITVVLLVVGTATLFLTFTVDYDDPRFAMYSMLLVACWVGVYVAGAGFRHEDRSPRRVTTGRAVLSGVLAGGGIGLLSAIGAWAMSLFGPTAGLIASVLGPIGAENFLFVLVTAVIVGAAEELAFRGGVFVLISRRPVLWSTVVYAVVTAATLNPALVFAAVVLGAGLAWLRHGTGRVLAPFVAHMTWTCVTLGLLQVLL